MFRGPEIDSVTPQLKIVTVPRVRYLHVRSSVIPRREAFILAHPNKLMCITDHSTGCPPHEWGAASTHDLALRSAAQEGPRLVNVLPLYGNAYLTQKRGHYDTPIPSETTSRTSSDVSKTLTHIGYLYLNTNNIGKHSPWNKCSTLPMNTYIRKKTEIKTHSNHD